MTQRQRVKKHHPVKHHVIAELKRPTEPEKIAPIVLEIPVHKLTEITEEEPEAIAVLVPKKWWQKLFD